MAHHARRSLDEIRELSPYEALLRDANIQNSSLDGSDNVLDRSGLGGTSFRHRGEHTSEVLELYLSKVTDLLQSEWDEIHRQDLTSRSTVRMEAVQQAETYWELFSDDATSDVYS